MFQSKIMKRTLFIITCVYLAVFIIAVVTSSLLNFREIKRQIDFNSSIIGMIEEGIVPDGEYIVENNPDTNYIDQGKDELEKYSYGTSNLSIFMSHKKVFLLDTLLIFVVIAMLYAITLCAVSRLYSKLTEKINGITKGLEKDIVSNVIIFENDDDIAIDLLKKNINALVSRSEYNNQKLKKDVKLTQKLLTDISHQIKTPLSSLKMYNEIILSDENIPKDDLRKFIYDSNLQIDRINWLVQGMLKLSRIESKAIEMTMKDSYIYDTIQNSIMPLQSLAVQKNIDIKLTCSQDIHFNHDEDWVSEALGNIVKNAIEHSYENSHIDITCSETPLTVEISVKDYGDGVKEKNIPKMFERFYHVQGAKASSVGIGLPLAKEILAKNNADIYVNSQYGSGCEFIITFLKKP